jgi:hypothetical protein
LDKVPGKAGVLALAVVVEAAAAEVEVEDMVVVVDRDLVAAVDLDCPYGDDHGDRGIDNIYHLYRGLRVDLEVRVVLLMHQVDRLDLLGQGDQVLH